MGKKQIIAILVGAAALALVLVIISKLGRDSGVALVETYVTPEIGRFEIIVTATGEIEAESSVNIEGPRTTNRRIRIENIDILDLVEEGTEVSKGIISPHSTKLRLRTPTKMPRRHWKQDGRTTSWRY